MDQMTEAIRYWTMRRTPEGVHTSWKLWYALERWCRCRDAGIVSDKIRKSSREFPLSSPDDVFSVHDRLLLAHDTELTHLLNAVVDTWRIVLERECQLPSSATNDDYFRLDSPNQVFMRLQAIDSRYVNHRTFTILMTAAISKTPPTSTSREKQRTHPKSPQYSEPSLETPILCERILHHMLELASTMTAVKSDRSSTPSGTRSSHQSGFDALFPDAVAFTSVLNAWARSGHPAAPVRALGVWSQWQELLKQVQLHRQVHGLPYNNDTFERCQPNVISYNTLIDAFCSTCDKDWVQRAEYIVHSMLDRHPQELPESHSKEHELPEETITPIAKLEMAGEIPRPNLVTFQLLIHAFTGLKDFDRCIYWLRRMIECDLGHVDIFSNVLSTAVLTKQYAAAEQVHQLLVEAMESPLVSVASDSSSSLYVTRAMLRLYAKTNRPHPAQQMLDKLEAMAVNAAAAAAAPPPDSASDTTDGKRRGDPRQLLNRVYYHNVLYSWVNSASTSSPESLRRGRRKNDAPTPIRDSRVFAAEQAERVLLRMIQISQLRDDSKVWAESHAVDSVLGLWAGAVGEGKNELRPSMVPSVSDQLYLERDPDRERVALLPEERAEALLRQLRWMGPVDLVQVSGSSYHKVLTAWSLSRHPLAPERVVALLTEMEQDPDVRPTRLHYTVALKACMNRYSPHGDERDKAQGRLEAIFDHALRQVSAGNIQAKPDARMLGTLLHAYARLGSGEGAERVLNLMLKSSQMGDRHASSANLTLSSLVAHPPTIREVNLALLAWLRSTGDPSLALSRCQALLGRVARLGLEPDDRSHRLLSDLRGRTNFNTGERHQHRTRPRLLTPTSRQQQSHRGRRQPSPKDVHRSTV
jgi:pentatricopeptide repeat protein